MTAPENTTEEEEEEEEDDRAWYPAAAHVSECADARLDANKAPA